MSEAPVKKRLSLDEILDRVSEIAQSESGPDGFRALKMLASMEQATVVIPPPLEDWEVVDRMMRLMHGAGPQLTQAAYARAFPKIAKKVLEEKRADLSKATREQRAEAHKITSLKLLNRKYPECKVKGTPKGYPQRGSVAQKVRWCQDTALKIMLEREEEARLAGHGAMTAAVVDGRRDTEVPTPAETQLQEPAL